MQHLAKKQFPYEAVYREAERRFQRSSVADALRVLSSLVESRPGDSVLARDVGFSAMMWGRGDEAYTLFRRVAQARPFEPQNYLAMARCLTDMGKVDLATVWFEVALAGKWQQRFGKFRKIAVIEYVSLLRKVVSGDLKSSVTEFAKMRLRKLSAELHVKEVDLLVTIMWNTDGTDVDLHVTDPINETCNYQNPNTQLGGRLLGDIRQGFGPEMFWLKSARPGRYDISVNYFSQDANRTSTRTRVYATIYYRWGTKNERVTRRVVLLEKKKGLQKIQQLRFK